MRLTPSNEVVAPAETVPATDAAVELARGTDQSSPLARAHAPTQPMPLRGNEPSRVASGDIVFPDRQDDVLYDPNASTIEVMSEPPALVTPIAVAIDVTTRASDRPRGETFVGPAPVPIDRTLIALLMLAVLGAILFVYAIAV